MMAKTILVTGGAGFIGSNLCRYLLGKEKDSKIICLDNLYTGRIENVVELIENDRFELVIFDIINYPKFFKKTKIDQIYHLACPASPKDYQKDPLYTSKISSIGTYNFGYLAIKKKARLLFTSTSEIYGDPEVHPQPEQYRGAVNTIGIRSCYDEGKRFSESILMDMKRQLNLDLAIVRIFNTYGPFMRKDDGRFISNFINQALEESPITIYGDGSQTRSICYVSDLIEGLWMMMNSEEVGPINIGNPIEKTVKEWAKQIIELTGSESEIIYEELPRDDPTRRNPDITLARTKLGWEPKILPDDGLMKTIIWFDGNQIDLKVE